MEPSPIVKRRLGSGYPNISPKNSKFDFELGNSILEPSMANNDIHSKVYEMGAAYRINQPINNRADVKPSGIFT